ncbi:MAG TPA: hypothetical protein VOA00_05335 [Thermoanaerobaculia bacterium]|nr:hypothetical protein [Thermoanaerobaculia bacterium]
MPGEPCHQEAERRAHEGLGYAKRGQRSIEKGENGGGEEWVTWPVRWRVGNGEVSLSDSLRPDQILERVELRCSMKGKLEELM